MFKTPDSFPAPKNIQENEPKISAIYAKFQQALLELHILDSGGRPIKVERVQELTPKQVTEAVNFKEKIIDITDPETREAAQTFLRFYEAPTIQYSIHSHADDDILDGFETTISTLSTDQSRSQEERKKFGELSAYADSNRLRKTNIYQLWGEYENLRDAGKIVENPETEKYALQLRDLTEAKFAATIDEHLDDIDNKVLKHVTPPYDTMNVDEKFNTVKLAEKFVRLALADMVNPGEKHS